MAYIGESLQHKGWLWRLASMVPAFRQSRRTELLDIAGLSDHLKRDMGFLDGVPTIKRR
jgi:hypothetical protein